MPFEALAETLLKNGIAPRHVRRYVRELSDHLDDLTAQQHTAGYDDEDAALRARARLGCDSELTAAMLEQKRFRSVASRAPWLVFGILPPAFAIAAAFVLIAPLAVTAKALHLGSPNHMQAPDWFRVWAYATAGLGNLILPAVMAAIFVFWALRQRLSYVWPLVAIILVGMLDMQFRARFPASGQPGGTISLGGTLWLLHWGSWLQSWPLSLARLCVTLLPATWLIRRNGWSGWPRPR